MSSRATALVGRHPLVRLLLGIAAVWILGSAAAAPESGRAADYRLVPWPDSAGSPDFQLNQAHDGRSVSLDSFRGRIVLLLFGFTRCPDVCPMELSTLAQALGTLGAQRSQVQVLFITLDPEHDSRERLTQYVRAFGSEFIGLTGTPTQVDRAAAAFHVQHARVPLGDDFTVDHSTVIFVIDTQGRVRLVCNAQTPEDDIAHDLQMLAVQATR